jgi:tyrosyl-tRNA synthetase
MKKVDTAKVEDILTRNVADIVEPGSLRARLSSGVRLRVKLGCDPTRPDLHIGHAVVLRALKDFQDLGHQIVFIIGDYTARIGDPSGRSQVRKLVTNKEIKENARTYFTQVGKILDAKKAEVRYNSEWLSKLKADDILRLNGEFTVSRILERDDFQKRLKGGAEVWMHELQYPLFQAYDSISVKADIEIGGTDQLFNFMIARHLMEKRGMRGQDIITYEILPGLDGKEKMSKSLDNYIGITEDRNNMFGKVMSLPDEMIIPYFRLATLRSWRDIQDLERRLKGENPRDLKLELAKEIVALYHGGKAAETARAEFIKVFSKKELPSAIEERELAEGSYEGVALLIALGLTRSRSEAWRLIEQGGVEVIPKRGLAQRLSLPRETVAIQKGAVVRAGKTRFVRVV